MLIDRYQPYFYNSNFSEESTEKGWSAFRGELILQEGEVADAQGRRKPPSLVLKEAVVLGQDDDLIFISGLLDELQSAPTLLERYSSDLSEKTTAIFFVVNIDSAFTVKHNQTQLVFIPLIQGMIWNELLDIALLEKSDIKKLSRADKVKAVYEDLKGKSFKYPESSLEAELGQTNDSIREAMGAI